MYKVVKKLQDAAISHRLVNGYPGKCKNIHGHTYHFEIEVVTSRLDKYDMAIDFGDIKKICDKFIQDNWDHAMLVTKDDYSLRSFLDREQMKHFVMDTNTTAENMSKFLVDKFWNLLLMRCPMLCDITVRVWETETSYAEASRY